LVTFPARVKQLILEALLTGEGMNFFSANNECDKFLSLFSDWYIKKE